MLEVEDNIRPGLGDGWIKVGAARCEKCGLGNWLRDDGEEKV